MPHKFLAYNKCISSEMINFFWAYTDVEVGTPYTDVEFGTPDTPSHNNSEEKRNFLKSRAISLSQPT